jgi:hypothetical protein
VCGRTCTSSRWKDFRRGEQAYFFCVASSGSVNFSPGVRTKVRSRCGPAGQPAITRAPSTNTALSTTFRGLEPDGLTCGYTTHASRARLAEEGNCVKRAVGAQHSRACSPAPLLVLGGVQVSPVQTAVPEIPALAWASEIAEPAEPPEIPVLVSPLEVRASLALWALH